MYCTVRLDAAPYVRLYDFRSCQYHLDAECCDVYLEEKKKQSTLHVVVIPMGYRQGYRCFKFDSPVGDAI